MLWARASLMVAVAGIGCTTPDVSRDASDSAVDTTTDEDGAATDAPRERADGPDAGDASGDGLLAGGGPITLVVDVAEISDERLCDLDGNGVRDNAFADLGNPMSELFTAFLGTFMQGRIEDPGDPFRLVLHLPWVDDRAAPRDPSAIGIIFKADDADDPPDAADDFAGDETYLVRPGALDACGEPGFYFPSLEIDDGAVSGSTPALPIPLGEGFPARDAYAEGTLAPGGASFEAAVCGYGTIADLGAVSADLTAEELSLLEVLLAGGWVLGMPSVPGIAPDVDVDGDGLERLTLDETGRIVLCVDGDSTEIPGSDCWSDPRMADAISLNFRLHAVAALFGGRRPGWEDDVEGTCDEGPPEESLFEPNP